MSPSFKELEGLAGNKFRLKKAYLPREAVSPREQFTVIEAPAPGQSSRVVLTGCLSGKNIVVGPEEDVFIEKVG